MRKIGIKLYAYIKPRWPSRYILDEKKSTQNPCSIYFAFTREFFQANYLRTYESDNGRNVLKRVAPLSYVLQCHSNVLFPNVSNEWLTELTPVIERYRL